MNKNQRNVKAISAIPLILFCTLMVAGWWDGLDLVWAQSRGWGYLNFGDPFNLGNSWFIWLGGLALLALYEYRLFR